jgi:hypothetical protein
VEEIRTTRGADEMAALNTATQAAVGSLTGRILHLEAQARAHEERLEVQMREFAAQQALIVQLLQELPNRVGNVVLNAVPPPVPPPQALPPHATPPVPPVPPPHATPPHATPPRRAPPEATPQAPPPEATPQATPPQVPPQATPPPRENEPPPTPPLPTPPRAPHNNPRPLNAAQAAHRRQAGMNALRLLRATPQVPSIAAKLPDTWPKLVSEWHARDLDSFVGVDTKEWGHTLVMRFNKRHNGLVEIDAQARQLFRGPLAELESVECRLKVADNLEESRTERWKIPLTKHIAMLRKENPNVKSRNSKRAAELEDDDSEDGI